MTDEVQRGLDYNLWPWPWPNSQVLGQHRETFTPFISDTEQQEGKLNTPVDLLTQDFSGIEDTLSFNMITSPFPDFKIRVRSVEEVARSRFQKKLQKKLQKELNLELKRLKVFELDWLKEALKQQLDWRNAERLEAELEARLERIRALRVFRWTLTKKVPASFSLKELISLLKSLRSGWGPPLEMATRMLNSKFWVMEADVWADLLIVCCWANPTYCEKCGNNVESVTTSCKHVVCPVCAVGKGNGSSCPKCGEIFTVLVFTSALPSTQEKPIRKRRLGEPPTTATKRPCIDSGTSMVTRSRSKPAKQTKQVSAIPLTTPDPAPPASKGSCSHEGQSESLTPDNLHKLLVDLRPAMIKWYYLGLALGLRHHDLDAIEIKRRGDSLDCLREMLITRLERKLSKEELIQSLQEETVGFSELAQTLKTQNSGDPKLTVKFDTELYGP